MPAIKVNIAKQDKDNKRKNNNKDQNCLDKAIHNLNNY